MTTYMEQRDAALKAASDLAEKAKAEDRELTVEEAEQINAKGAESEELNEKIKAARSDYDIFASLGTPKSAEQEQMEKDALGATLGDHATMNLKDALTRIKAQRSGTTASAVDFPLSDRKSVV